MMFKVQRRGDKFELRMGTPIARKEWAPLSLGRRRWGHDGETTEGDRPK